MSDLIAEAERRGFRRGVEAASELVKGHTDTFQIEGVVGTIDAILSACRGALYEAAGKILRLLEEPE